MPKFWKFEEFAIWKPVDSFACTKAEDLNFSMIKVSESLQISQWVLKDDQQLQLSDVNTLQPLQKPNTQV